MRDNPWIEPATTAPSLYHRHDRVLAEMLDVPRVLDRVQCDWDDPASLNRRTERAFSEHLLLNAQAAQTRDQGRRGSTINADLDLLVLGVENSLYVGQRFVQDLLRILPNIHARAVDAVSYCEEPQRYGLGPETITLAMSHSGQTFNTLDAVKFIQALHLIGKTGPIFVMTGEIDTLMGAAVGQRFNASAKWNERLFSTWGGWRTAEPALAFIATALHLFLMLWLGWNPVIGAQDLLFSTTGWPAFDAGTPVGSVLKVSFETAYFLFAGVAFMLMLRWLQGRRLWDRVFVGRTLVVGDEPYVKNLLSQFVSKLFSLAYEFAGFAAIHAADTRSGDMLHTFGHRITRGLLLYLGLPDGRWPGRERAEAAVHMTSSQARGVQSMGTGATVFGIGHNPGSADKIDRFIHLGLSARRAEALPWMLRGHWSELARELQESRFASFERLLASYVVFHCAAATTRDLMNRLVPLANLIWSPVFYSVKLLTGGRVRVRFGYWNLARTQSGTRIATTAAPVPANIHAPEQYLTPVERYAGAASAVERGAEAEIPVPESLAAPAKPVWVPPQAALPKASLFHLLPLVVLVCPALALALSGALGPPAFI